METSRRLTPLYAAAFVDMVGMAMILPLLPFHAGAQEASASAVGGLIAAYALAQLVAAPLWGRYSDRAGRQPAIVLGLIVSGLGFLAFALADSLAALLVSRVVQGMGAGTIGVIQASVAEGVGPADRTRRLGWLSAVTSLGAMAGPALGSLLSAAGPWAPGAIASVGSLLVAAWAWRGFPPAVTLPDPAIPGAVGRSGPVGVSRRVGALLAVYTVAIGAFYGMIPTAPLLLEARLGIGVQAVGWFIMYLGGIGVLMRAVMLGPLVDRLGEARLAASGAVLLAAGLVVSGTAGGWGGMLLGFTLMPMGTACLFPAVTAMLSGSVPPGARGLVLGVQQTCGGISRVAFPLAAGVTMDLTGPGVPFVAAGLLALATVVLLRAAAGAAYLGRSPSWVSRPARST